MIDNLHIIRIAWKRLTFLTLIDANIFGSDPEFKSEDSFKSKQDRMKKFRIEQKHTWTSEAVPAGANATVSPTIRRAIRVPTRVIRTARHHALHRASQR